MKIFITFGQDHRHEIDGVVFDKDCVAVISAINGRVGFDKTFGLFAINADK